MHFNNYSFIWRLTFLAASLVSAAHFIWSIGFAVGITQLMGSVLGAVLFGALSIFAGYLFVKYYAVNAVLVGDIARAAQQLARKKYHDKQVTIGHLTGFLKSETGGRVVIALASPDSVEYVVYTVTDGSIVSNLEIPIDVSEARLIRAGLLEALVWKPVNEVEPAF